MPRVLRATLLAAFAPGCFTPSYPQGLACSEGDTCPPGQRCDTTTNVCVSDTPARDGGADGPEGSDGGADASPPARWTTMSVGGAHVCAIRESDAALHCWGHNGFGQLGDGTHEHRATPTPVVGGGRWISVAAGSNHTCAVRESGELLCFGLNDFGQLGDGTAAERPAPTAVASGVAGWKRVSAGESHTCAVDAVDGLWCWGQNESGQVGDGSGVASRSMPVAVAAGATWVSLDLGSIHSCGIRGDGSLWCWGSGGSGRLGVGDANDRIVPTQVPGTWTDVGAGYFHTCATSPANELYCWGADNGILGLGPQTITERPSPTLVGSPWTAVGVGRFHTCALADTGALSCFGWNDAGALGDGSLDGRDVPTAILGGASDWAEVDGGGATTCARKTSGELWCWGQNAYGQLAAIGPGSKNAPGPALRGQWEVIGDSYGSEVCGLRTGGAAECWGSNYAQLLGVDGPNVVQSPLPVRGGLSFQAIVRGHITTYGISAGRLYGWGSNISGWLGDGTTMDRDTPTAIGAASDWSWISSANSGACGVRGGLGFCWGYGGGGRLGDGTAADRTQPSLVAGGITTWRQIEIGSLHTCGIAEPVAGQRQLYCWGSNYAGQLGDGTTTPRSAPVRIGAESDWLLVSLGDSHTCGLRAGGRAWCWGDNADGQLGDGSTFSRPTPNPVAPVDVAWTTLDAGGSTTCGVRTGGTLWCWGSNSQGQLGVGSWSTAQLEDGEQVGAGTTWVDVRVLDAATCARDQDGVARCWGANYQGTLGDGTAFRWEPVPVVGP